MSSPTSVVSRKINQNKFWLEASALEGICALISRNGFQGKISNKGGDSFLVKECVSEDSSSHLPNYIARLESYTELECRELIRQMAENIRALHEQRVVHRNLNIDNVLVVQETVRLRGLRYAKARSNDEPLVGYSGFRHNWYAFRAPETEGDSEHTESADIWSLGAILYFLLTGLPPFRGSGRQLIRNKRVGNIEYDMVFPSHSAQRLVQAMLQVDPQHRLTIQQVLDHEWMKELDEVLVGYDLSLAQDFFRDWENVGRDFGKELPLTPQFEI